MGDVRLDGAWVRGFLVGLVVGGAAVVVWLGTAALVGVAL